MNYENCRRCLWRSTIRTDYEFCERFSSIFGGADRFKLGRASHIRQGEWNLSLVLSRKSHCTPGSRLGKGVCGTAAKLGKTQLCVDVHNFQGISPATVRPIREIVVLLWKEQNLDIDSPERPF